MSSQTINAIYRKDYQSLCYLIDEIHLVFELKEDCAWVTNTMLMRSMDKKKPLELQGDELELVSCEIDGEALAEKQYQKKNGHLILTPGKDQFTVKIKTKIKPQENTQLSGLYRSNDLFCTQCEAEGFRRITYYLDRPDILSIFTTKIIADKKKYPVLLSNGNLQEKGDLADGLHYVVWHDPFKKPSYLFALVAGDLASIADTFTTASSQEVTLKIFCEHGNEDKCAHAMASLKKAMLWDEKVYGREYDLAIFMIVAVSDFNMGAMENKGLNIFNSKYVLAQPTTATDNDFMNIEGVVAHEYFHNWTGNRVTCRDWFQLSLKEGLTVFRDQEFSRDMNSRDVGRIEDVKVLRANQFPEDAGPMAHPVRPESYMEINNFYTATVYNKGAEVIRMQHTLLGEAGFRKGCDLYFSRHDGQAVTIDDFVAAMEHANHIDLTQFKRWYSQAGTPEIRVRTVLEDNCFTLKLTQYCPKTPGEDEKLPFHIPIGIALFTEEGEQIAIGHELIQLREEKQEFHYEGISSMPVVSLLRGFSAPVKLHIEQSDEALNVLMQHETDGFARFEAASQFAKNKLHQLIEQYNKQEAFCLDETVIALYGSLLDDDKIDRALKALMLQIPDFESIANDLTVVDVDAVLKARAFFTEQLAIVLKEKWQAVYDAHQEMALDTMNAQSFAIRKLRNVCLYYLTRGGQGSELAYKQFQQAKNMTDELAAFHLLVEHNNAMAQKAETAFYDKWKKDVLVLDKWFAALASSPASNTLEKVKSLLTHPDFYLNNPNKVRALIGGFSQLNPQQFHAIDGSAYHFLKDKVLQLDKINPQIAARLVTPLSRFKRYDKERQKLMHACLKEMSQVSDLSKDVYEIVNKSLEV